MSYGSYLSKSRHGTIFYARITIPLSLRHHFGGKREFRISLKTPCKVKAKRFALDLWLNFQVVYDALRDGHSLNNIHVPHGVLAALKIDKKTHENTTALVSSTPPPPLPLLKHRSLEKLPPLNGLVLRYIKSTYRGQMLEVDTGCVQDDRATISQLMDEIDRRLGPPLTLPQVATNLVNASPEPKLFDQVADDYIQSYRLNREYDKTFRMSTFDKEARNVLFWKYYFSSTPLDQIGIQACRDAELHCRNYPKNVDAKVAALMCRSSHERKTTGAQATKNRLLVLKNILEHAVKYGWLNINPAKVIDTTQRRSAGAVDKHPFTIDELKLIFPGPDYGKLFNTRATKRDTAYDCAKFWAPLIGLLSGARLGEIIQLELNDIRQEDGIWYFDITTESDEATSGKELKTSGSRRRVPIHSMLIKMGLLDYVGQRKEHPLRPIGLFDHYVRGAPGKGKAITEWFKGGPNGVDRNGKPRMRYGYLDRCGVLCRPDQRTDGSSVSFHSFRHTFADAARQGTLPSGEAVRDEDIRWILGHASGLTTTRYGKGKGLSFLSSIVETVQFLEVDLTPISWAGYQQKTGVSAVSASL